MVASPAGFVVTVTFISVTLLPSTSRLYSAGPVIAYESTANVTAMEWFPVTAGKVYVARGLIRAPSTVNVATWYPLVGVKVKSWSAPWFTDTFGPAGATVPFDPAVTVMVYELIPN